MKVSPSFLVYVIFGAKFAGKMFSKKIKENIWDGKGNRDFLCWSLLLLSCWLLKEPFVLRGM